MKIVIRYLAIIAAPFALSGLFATPAAAQATRTWVSGVGDDANPCSRTAPCKTFAGAISKTAAGGEINCLDPGGFGGVTITKSITIDCTGTLGSILAASSSGVIVNGANVVVSLRGLAINGGTSTSPGVNGVRFVQGARLSIEDCVIFNFGGASPNGFGVLVNNSSGGTSVHIRNTVIRNNGTATSGGGIGAFPTGAAAVRITLENVSLNFNFRGIDMNTAGTTAGNTLTVSGSTINFNTENAINVTSGANAASVMINQTTISNNVRGVITNGTGATARIGSSVIANNGTAVSANGGSSIQSYRNNQIDLNGNNNTPIPQVTLN